MRGLPAAVAVFFSLSLACAYAADGDPDPSFGSGGMQRFEAVHAYGEPAVTVDADGRIVVCDGDQRDIATDYDLLIERFNADGSPDITFGVGGETTLSFDDQGVEDLCSAIALQQNGAIVVAGVREFPGFGTRDPYFLVARLTAGGVLDATFAGGAGYTVFPYEVFGLGGATAVAIDASGRIIVAGGSQPDVGNEDFAIARLMPDGTFDATFSGSGSETIGFFSSLSYDYATHVATDAEGRIVLAGNAGGETALVRLLDDGTLDPAFGFGGSALLPAGPGSQGFVIDHAGRLLVAGSVPSPNDNQNADFAAARLLADGSLDTSFGNGGIASIAFDLADGGGGRDGASAIVEQSDGKLVLLGSAEYGDLMYNRNAAARLLDDGTLDPSFGNGGKITFAFGLAMPSDDWLSGAALDGGHVIVVGRAGQGEGGIVDDIVARLESDLVFRATFE